VEVHEWDDEEKPEEVVVWLLVLELDVADVDPDDEDRLEEVVDRLLDTDVVDDEADDEVEVIVLELEVLALETVELVEIGSTDEDEDDEELDVKTLGASWYISSLFPAPQYSKLFPGHKKEQSPMFSMTDPALMEFPQ